MNFLKIALIGFLFSGLSFAKSEIKILKDAGVVNINLINLNENCNKETSTELGPYSYNPVENTRDYSYLDYMDSCQKTVEVEGPYTVALPKLEGLIFTITKGNDEANSSEVVLFSTGEDGYYEFFGNEDSINIYAESYMDDNKSDCKSYENPEISEALAGHDGNGDLEMDRFETIMNQCIISLDGSVEKHQDQLSYFFELSHRFFYVEISSSYFEFTKDID